MIINFIKILFSTTVFFSLSIMITAVAQAQDVDGFSESRGRTAGTTIDMNNNNTKAIQRIRDHINKGEYDRAISRANRFIRVEDRGSRSGLGKTDFYIEAHNSICVSLTGQIKIEEAMEACNTSLEHSPKHWESLKSRALLYYMTQDFPKSLEDFTSALNNAPDVEELTNILKQNISVVQSRIN